MALDHNGLDGAVLLPRKDCAPADLLIKAAAGVDVEREIVTLIAERSGAARATRTYREPSPAAKVATQGSSRRAAGTVPGPEQQNVTQQHEPSRSEIDRNSPSRWLPRRL